MFNFKKQCRLAFPFAPCTFMHFVATMGRSDFCASVGLPLALSTLLSLTTTVETADLPGTPPTFVCSLCPMTPAEPASSRVAMKSLLSTAAGYPH